MYNSCQGYSILGCIQAPFLTRPRDYRHNSCHYGRYIRSLGRRCLCSRNVGHSNSVSAKTGLWGRIITLRALVGNHRVGEFKITVVTLQNPSRHAISGTREGDFEIREIMYCAVHFGLNSVEFGRTQRKDVPKEDLLWTASILASGISGSGLRNRRFTYGRQDSRSKSRYRTAAPEPN